jgi:HEAT repeat protein
MPTFRVEFIQHRFTKGDVSGLAKALRHRDNLARQEAAAALGELADPRAVPLLIAAYADPRAKGAETTIIRALGRIGGDAAADFLADVYYQRPASEAAGAALVALQAIGGARAEEALRAGRAVDDVKSSDPERRARGMAELRLLGPEARRVLLAELDEWAMVKHNPDLSMADAIEADREVKEIVNSLRDALDSLSEAGA